MNDWALITGSAKRVGAAIARELHQKGLNVLIHYKSSSQEAAVLCSELNHIRPGSAVAIQADLETSQGLENLMTQVKLSTSTLRVLVNNASVFSPTPIESTTYQDFQAVLATNLIAPYMLSLACRPLLNAGSGSIINLLDIHGTKPLAQHGLYSISKAALEMATLSLSQELAPNVRVNGVAPGAILWPEDSNETTQNQVSELIPLQRVGQAQDIAKTVVFLMDAEYITGQVIAVDGGRSATGYKGAN